MYTAYNKKSTCFIIIETQLSAGNTRTNMSNTDVCMSNKKLNSKAYNVSLI